MPQSALDRALVDALFDVIPEDWRAFRLIITPPETTGAAPGIALLNPERADAAGVPGPEVERLAGEVVALLGRENRPWPQISYHGQLDDDGGWRLRIVAPLPPELESPAP